MKTFNANTLVTVMGALFLTAASAEASNYGDKEAGYDGTVNTTVSGKTCHTWSEIAELGPNKYDRMNAKWKATYNGASLPNHNFCRNPDSSERAWCYIKDATTAQVEAGEIAATWEYCNVDADEGAPSSAGLFDSSKTYLKSIGGTTYEVSELTVCDAGEFQSVAPTLTSDRTCSPHSKPAPHQRIKTAGTALVDAVMENTCSDSEWYNNGSCKALTVCDATQDQSQAPTATSDRVCGPKSDVVSYTYKATPLNQRTGRADYDQLVGSDGTTVRCARGLSMGWRKVYCWTGDVTGRISITGIPSDTHELRLEGGNIRSIVHIDGRFPPDPNGSYGLGVQLHGKHKNFDDACPTGLTRKTGDTQNESNRIRFVRYYPSHAQYQCQ